MKTNRKSKTMTLANEIVDVDVVDAGEGDGPKEKKDSLVRVLAFGALPPDNLELFVAQHGMRYRYRKVLTFHNEELRRKKEAVYTLILGEPSTEVVAARVLYADVCERLKDAKRNKPRKRSADFAAWKDGVEDLKTEYRKVLEDLRKAEKTRNAAKHAACKAAGEKRVPDPILNEWIKERLKEIGPNSDAMRSAKEARGFASWAIAMAKATCGDGIDVLDRLNFESDLHALDVKEATNAVQAAGLFHGSYSAESDSAKRAAKDAFRRIDCPSWTKDGSVRVQTQNDNSWEAILAGENGNLRVRRQTEEEIYRCRSKKPGTIDRKTGEIYGPRSKRPGCIGEATAGERYRVSIRAAKLAAGKREKGKPRDAGTWIEADFVLHRPLPPDARILWASLQRRMVGYHARWRLLLTVRSETFRRATASEGKGDGVLHFGWRRVFDAQGELVKVRTALFLHEDGTLLEAVLPDGCQEPRRPDDPPPTSMTPNAIRNRARRARRRARGSIDQAVFAEKLRGNRDEHMDEIRDVLTSFFRPLATERPPELPDEADPVRTRARYVAKWRAVGKFVLLLGFWRARRFAGDEETFAALETYCSRDAHHWVWEARVRDRSINRRNDGYRKFVARISKMCDRIWIAKFPFDVPAIAERNRPDADDDDRRRVQRRIARICAPGHLASYLEQAAAKTGYALEKFDPSQITQQCHLCGHDAKWDARPDLMHACEGCDTLWDQDENACRNSLAVVTGRPMRFPPSPTVAPTIGGEDAMAALRDGGKISRPRGKRRDRSDRVVQEEPTLP